MSIELQERAFDTPVVTINYAEGPPSGPPLVLLHGGSARWQSFEGIIPYLAPRWHLFAPEFRGNGKSGRVPGSYRFQDYTDDTIAFFHQRVAEPAFLFGHSLGGEVALLVAAQCPDLVRAVVVGDSPLDTGSHRPKYNYTHERTAAWRELAGGKMSIERVAEALKDAPTEVVGQDKPVLMREKYSDDDPVFMWLATNLYYCDPDMLTALLDDFETTSAGYEMDKVLPAIRCPVLLLQADPDHGGVMTDGDVAQALPLLAHPKHVRLQDIGHFFIGQKEPVLSVLTEFLDPL